MGTHYVTLHPLHSSLILVAENNPSVITLTIILLLNVIWDAKVIVTTQKNKESQIQYNFKLNVSKDLKLIDISLN